MWKDKLCDSREKWGDVNPFLYFENNIISKHVSDITNVKHKSTNVFLVRLSIASKNEVHRGLIRVSVGGNDIGRRSKYRKLKNHTKIFSKDKYLHREIMEW